MNKHAIARPVLVATLLVAAATFAPVGMAAPPPEPPLPGAASQFTTAERAFVTQAAPDGVYEVQAAQLAVGRAVNPQVKAYADMLVTQHMQANGELNVLLQAKAMTMPPDLPADKVAKLQALGALAAGPAFDRGFIDTVGVQDHATAIALFERARGDVVDRDLRAWIDKTLPVLRSHLSAAQSIAALIGG
jgi:putative membrane protein